jgi:DNA-binding HxlR family transcriptional regulator
MGNEIIPFLTNLEEWGNKWMRNGANLTNSSSAAN